jgi:hypothetical protein
MFSFTEKEVLSELVNIGGTSPCPISGHLSLSQNTDLSATVPGMGKALLVFPKL